jgi:uroporphyrinogen-III decarboxylase
MPGTKAARPVSRERLAAASRSRQTQRVPSWALLSMALSHETRVQAGRPDVDAAVQLAAEIALSEPRKFRYNRGE